MNKLMPDSQKERKFVGCKLNTTQRKFRAQSNIKDGAFCESI